MEEELSNATWRTACGELIEVEDLSNRHLINIHKMLIEERRGFTLDKFWNGKFAWVWRGIMEIELECRGLLLNEEDI